MPGMTEPEVVALGKTSGTAFDRLLEKSRLKQLAAL
jgi:hypothetical protein